jgi:hypothetical protein
MPSAWKELFNLIQQQRQSGWRRPSEMAATLISLILDSAYGSSRVKSFLMRWRYHLRRAAPILRRLESAGYVVKVFRVNGVVEMHAIASDGSFRTARCKKGDGEIEMDRAARLLADACGVDVETPEGHANERDAA